MSYYSERSSYLKAAIWTILAGLTAGCETTGSSIGVAEFALIPPPPVNQNIGIYDRTFAGIVAGDCLRCHDGSGGTTCPNPTTNCQVVSLRHHMMLDPSSPRYKPAYDCLSCHTPDESTGVMSVTFNCPQCHTTTPHHKSAPAKARHCAACHGTLVNNYDDGHYIPTYPKSPMTPDPDCHIWTDATHTICSAGGCRTCHVASTAITPNTWSNDSTHHGTGLGQSQLDNPPEQCGWCHSVSGSTAAIDIRTCETCHGPTSLHAIEFQYDTNKGKQGYGHVGADQDCWGCHGYLATHDQPPAMGPTVPTVDSIKPASVDSGVATEIDLDGQSFTNSSTSYTGKVTIYNPVVVLSLLDEAGTEVASLDVAPTSFTESTLRVAVPASLRNGIWELRIAKDRKGPKEQKSNKASLVVKSKVAINAACVDGTAFTVNGRGFGPQPPAGAPIYGLFADGVACTVSSWSNTQVVGTCSNPAKNGEAKVVGAYGSATATIMNNCK